VGNDPISGGRLAALQGMGGGPGAGNPSPDDTGEGAGPSEGDEEMELSQVVDMLRQYVDDPDVDPEEAQDLSQAADLIEKHAGGGGGSAEPPPADDQEVSPPVVGSGETGA
jgi:hypothetical protein